MEKHYNKQKYMKSKIIFTKEATEKLWQYVFAVKTEISGYGKTHIDSAGNFVVTDIALFEQKVSGVDTTIDAQSVAKFQYELHKKGESMDNWKLWWHSHNNMNVFWSPTDRTAMSKENNFGRDYLISVVVNFKKEKLGCVDLYEPFRETFDNIEVCMEQATVIPKSIQDEVNKKVKQREVVGYNTGKATPSSFSNSGLWESPVTKNPHSYGGGYAKPFNRDEGYIREEGFNGEEHLPVAYSDELEYYGSGYGYNTPAKQESESLTETVESIAEQLGLDSSKIPKNDCKLIFNYLSRDGSRMSNKNRKKARRLIEKYGL